MQATHVPTYLTWLSSRSMLVSSRFRMNLCGNSELFSSLMCSEKRCSGLRRRPKWTFNKRKNKKKTENCCVRWMYLLLLLSRTGKDQRHVDSQTASTPKFPGWCCWPLYSPACCFSSGPPLVFSWCDKIIKAFRRGLDFTRETVRLDLAN